MFVPFHKNFPGKICFYSAPVYGVISGCVILFLKRGSAGALIHEEEH